uniref:Uncharacterized protein n=1 Tax=Caenorhabditis japonica TaxID=281687 RepID=A0A8R1EI81_CAEJA
MADEPMEEDDSFYQPVPFSAPFVKPTSTQLPPVHEEQNDSGPDSDDSFDNFAATQSTGGSTAKSTASGTQSADSGIFFEK